jgi:hypothetical protein
VSTFNGYSRNAYFANSAREADSAWNFIPADPTADPSASLTEDPELERYLVEEIARAKRRRPLMKRLANVEAAYSADLPSFLAKAAAPAVPPPLPSLHAVPQSAPMAVANGAPIDRLMDEFHDECTAPPQSAEWLDNARRERRRGRLRALVAWIATVAIGTTVIAVTMQALKG